MADENLNIRISLNLNIYKEGMLDVLKIGRITAKNLTDMFSGTKVDIDLDQVKKEFDAGVFTKSINSYFNSFWQNLHFIIQTPFYCYFMINYVIYS